jgi:hypothetical protein
MLRTLRIAGSAAAALASALLAQPAAASTLNQNTSWTINRSGTSTVYRVVGYGDSIYAGYRGSVFNVARRAPPPARARR